MKCSLFLGLLTLVSFVNYTKADSQQVFLSQSIEAVKAADLHAHEHRSGGNDIAEAGDESHFHEQHSHTAHASEEHSHEENNHQRQPPQRTQDDHDEVGGDHQAHGHDEHDATVCLTTEQMRLAGITVMALQPQRLRYGIYAPGEIKANEYASYNVSPRVQSIVLRRHVALGDGVVVDQPVVTLFSDAVADAQADYLIDYNEWQRVQQLGRQSVGDKRFLAAEANHQAAYSRLTAYGLNQRDITGLIGRQYRLGEYTLRAAITGVVLADHFQQGQAFAAGQTLMLLANEAELWVEARLPPQQRLAEQSRVSIIAYGQNYPAKIAQQAHTIDPLTRTRILRLLVDNKNHQLHPGMFVDVYFAMDGDEPVMAVPEEALIRQPDGRWQVFVESQAGEFSSVVVELAEDFQGWHEERGWQRVEGLLPGQRVVTNGAFFVASQFAKDQFDPHNH